jgi:hypothetical protein
MHLICRGAAIAALVGLGVLCCQSGAQAQEVDKALEERIAKEKEARRDCKIKICSAAINKRVEGDDIACNVLKTWTAPDLKGKILRDRFSWPWGHAQCSADVKLSRKPLAVALASGEHEIAVDKHNVTCTLDQKDGTDKYSISFAIKPTVKFKDGKAIKASLNWSDIQGSAVAKGAVWSTATLDNYTGILEGVVVDAVNEFFGPLCDEVKADLK